MAGEVNGWCTDTQRASSSLHSNSGGSTIQQNVPGVLGDEVERDGEVAPKAVEGHVGPVGAVGNDAHQVAFSGPGRGHDARRSLPGPGTSPPATGPRRRLRRRATPGRRRHGPWPLRSVCRAPCARTTRAPGAARALIAPPSASTFANALNPVRANTGAEIHQLHAVSEVRLVRSVPLASSRRRSCAGTARPPRPPRCPCTIRAYSGSIRAIRSSSVTKLISTSSWVNSNPRSAREASSRRQRTIW